MPRSFSFKSRSRLAKAVLGTFLLLASIATSVAPFFIPPAVAQDANNTDIFTGQFIPAYLGAAYDPSEAYKQMAGMTVYVFAYDRPGIVINSRVYKTQVRADGSFQAAGLANASHYGICFPGRVAQDRQPFRVPLNQDNLNTVFAFNSGTWPGSDQPQDQNGAQIDRIPGCRTFFTSSKTVDIANHVNIFPLVPQTVLSVIIKDPATSDASGSIYDPHNYNTPYEIYAQRVLLAQETRIDCAAQGCPPERAYTYTTEYPATINGPVIRGRSASLGEATIFQAYAPPGVYAITYWRPDIRDAQKVVTYLNFDGESSLGTPYNGVAFEHVEANGGIINYQDGDAQRSSDNQWLLSRRSLSAESGNVWNARPGSVSIWGVAGSSSASGNLVPVSGIPVSIDSNWLGFMDPSSAQKNCNPSRRVTGRWGIFLFTSACRTNTGVLPSTEATLSSYQATISGTTYLGNPSIRVRVNGLSGPSRHNVPVERQDPYGVEMRFPECHGPKQCFTPDTAVDLRIDGKTFASVARINSDGKLFIPSVYFTHNPSGRFTISTSSQSQGLLSKRSKLEQLSFVIDGSGLPGNPTQTKVNLGMINPYPKQSPLASTLAMFNLGNLRDVFRVPQVWAGQGDGKPEDLNRASVPIYLDMGHVNRLMQNENWFTYGNYNLTKIELDYPSNVINGLSDSNYAIFDRHGGSADEGQENEVYLSQNGIIATNGNGACWGDVRADGQEPTELVDCPNFEGSAPSDGTIVGVLLKEKTDADTYKLDNVYDTYRKIHGDADVAMPLMLKVQFELKKDESVGQGEQSQYPTRLSAEVPIYFSRTGDEGGPNRFYYSLVPLSVDPVGCGGGSDGGFLGTGIGPSVTGTLTEIPCQLTNFGMWIINKTVHYIADNLITVDPLGFSDITADFWNITRNLVNALAVLILVASGIAIMLRYQPTMFNLQNVLTKLVMTIILVNFSILIIQVVIDVANVIASGGYQFITDALINTNGDVGGALAGAGAMAGITAAVITAAVASGGGAGVIIFLVFGALFLVFGFILFKAIWFWILRNIVLVICIIAAPIAIAARVFPGTESYYKKWQSMLAKTLVAQILFAFVLALAMVMLYKGISTYGNLMDTLVTFGIAGGLFYYSTKFPAQAMAALGDAPAIGSLAKLAAGKLAAGQKKLQSEFVGKEGRIRRAQRRGASEGEDAYRKARGMKELNRLQRGFRFGSQVTGMGTAGLEAEKARQDSIEAGVKTGANLYRLEGQDPDKLLRREVEARTRTTYENMLKRNWKRTHGGAEIPKLELAQQMSASSGEIERIVNDRLPTARSTERRNQIARQQQDIIKRAQESVASTTAYESIDKDAQRILSNLSPKLSTKGKREGVKSTRNDPNREGLYAGLEQTSEVLDALELILADQSKREQHALASVVRDAIIKAGSPDLNPGWFESWANKSSELETWARENERFDDANIDNNDHIDLTRGFLLNDVANTVRLGSGAKSLARAKRVDRGESTEELAPTRAALTAMAAAGGAATPGPAATPPTPGPAVGGIGGAPTTPPPPGFVPGPAGLFVPHAPRPTRGGPATPPPPGPTGGGPGPTSGTGGTGGGPAGGGGATGGGTPPTPPPTPSGGGTSGGSSPAGSGTSPAGTSSAGSSAASPAMSPVSAARATSSRPRSTASDYSGTTPQGLFDDRGLATPAAGDWLRRAGFPPMKAPSSHASTEVSKQVDEAFYEMQRLQSSGNAPENLGAGDRQHLEDAKRILKEAGWYQE